LKRGEIERERERERERQSYEKSSGSYGESLAVEERLKPEQQTVRKLGSRGWNPARSLSGGGVVVVVVLVVGT